MNGIKDLAKSGWHPKGNGEGGKESWRNDFKGVNTVAGWKDKAMGKGGKAGASATARENHVSTPLETLKDPGSFGPPPKHRAIHGDAAGPARSRPARDGEQARQREDEVNARPPPGSRPGQAPPPPATTQSTKPKPSLPPRLPPRQNSHPDAYAPEPPPTYSESTQDSAPGGNLNQGALNRLGQAGVSVLGLNIGRNASPPLPPRQSASPSLTTPPEAPRTSQMSELQSRFARMPSASSSSPSSSAAPNPASTGTTWAEKQAALKTANNLHSDPSKVSLSDMRSTASTANKFRERHGEQAAAGWKTASNLNQKYGIAGKVNGLASGSTASSPAQAPAPAKGASASGKKAPPPPPPKRRELNATGEPPPIPLGSKPKF